jgi:hypothetical protein
LLALLISASFFRPVYARVTCNGSELPERENFFADGQVALSRANP